MAVAAAVGLALFLWLPYLLARPLGIAAGARVALGVLALLAVVGFWRIAIAGSMRNRTRRPATAPGPLLVVALLTVVVGGFLYNASLRVRDGNLCSAGGGCEDMGMHRGAACSARHDQMEGDVHDVDQAVVRAREPTARYRRRDSRSWRREATMI